MKRINTLKTEDLIRYLEAIDSTSPCEGCCFFESGCEDEPCADQVIRWLLGEVEVDSEKLTDKEASDCISRLCDGPEEEEFEDVQKTNIIINLPHGTLNIFK